MSWDEPFLPAIIVVLLYHIIIEFFEMWEIRRKTREIRKQRLSKEAPQIG